MKPITWFDTIGKLPRLSAETRLMALFGSKPEVHAETEKTQSRRGKALWVSNVLANNLDEIQKMAERERNPEKRQELQGQYGAGKDYLNRIQQKIETPRQMEEMMDEWDKLNELDSQLQSKDTEYKALVGVMDSGFMAFLKDVTISRAIISKERIRQTELVKRAFDPFEMEKVRKEAELEFDDAAKRVVERADALKNQTEVGSHKTEKYYEGNKGEEIKKRQLEDHERAEYGKAAEYYRENAGGGREEWVRKRELQLIAKKVDYASYSEKIRDEVGGAAMFENLKELVNEALGLIQERMADSLDRKMADFDKAVEWLDENHGKSLMPDTMKDLRATSENIRKEIKKRVGAYDPLGKSPGVGFADLKEIVEGIEVDIVKAVESIQEKGKALAEFRESREKRLERIKKKHGFVKSFMGKAVKSAPSMVEEAKKALAEGKVAFSSDPEFAQMEKDEFRKWIEGNEKADPDAMEVLGQQQDFDKMSDEEALDFEGQIESTYQKVERPMRADKAKQAMQLVGQARTVGEALKGIVDTVEEHPEDPRQWEHVELVSHDEFEKEYRKHTQTGYMVFYERGDEWKIIVDRSHLDEGADLAMLKTQLTHELRHMEFEGDERLKAGWVKAFTSEVESKTWEKIKAAFVNTFHEKMPPTVDPEQLGGWKDEDVLSELYAMGTDMRFLGELESAARKLGRKASYYANPIARKDYPGFETEQWASIRNTFAAESVRGAENVADWSDDEVLAEIQSMDKEWERHPKLGAALADAGVQNGYLKNAKRYNEEPGEVIRGFVASQVVDAKSRDADEVKKDVTKKDLVEELDILGKQIKDFQDSPFLPQVPGLASALSGMAKFVKRAKGEMDEAEKKGMLGNAEALIKELKFDLADDKNVKSVKRRLMKVSEDSENPETSFFRQFWKNTSFYSFADFKAVYEHGKDYLTRYFKREAGIHKGNLSKLIFEDINEGLALESSSFISGAWKEAVQGWEEKLKSKEPWKLWKYMKEQSESGNPKKEIVVALINQLVDKGAMDWTNKDFLICANALQNATKLDPNDKLLYTDKNYLREKLKKAMGAGPFYNKTTAFADRDRDNTNNYDKKKGEYEGVIKESAYLVADRLKQLLIRKKGGIKDKGEFKNFKEEMDYIKKKGDKDVDAKEYEALLEQSIVNGYYEPENIVFYLLSGMGSGLIKPQTAGRLAKHFNEFPVMEFFNSMTRGKKFLTQEQIWTFCMKKFKNEYQHCELEDVGKSEFMQFYWSEIMNHDTVKERTLKNASKGKWDHDWSRGIAGCMDATIANGLLRGTSSIAQNEHTQIPNVMAGVYVYFDQNQKAKKAGRPVPALKKNLVREIGGYAMFETILSGAAFSDSTSYYRSTNIPMSMKPREGVMAGHDDWTFKDFENKLNGMMERISPTYAQFFRMANDSVAAAEDDDAHHKRLKEFVLANAPGIDAKMVKDSKTLYGNIGSITEAMLSNVSEDQILAAIGGAL